jgi:hypothetical protein
MALKKLGVVRTIYFLFCLSELFCIVLTQEGEPPSLAEHVEYQAPTGDNQPPIQSLDSAPAEIQEQPNVALHQSEPNEIDEAFKSLNDPSYANVNQDLNEPVVVNQAPDGVQQAVNVLYHQPDVADQAPRATDEPPNVVNQGFAAPNPNVANQHADAPKPHGVHNPNVVNQPPNQQVYNQHRPSTVDFDLGSVESVEVNNDFENLPGVQHEFRIEVAAGKKECIFQKLAENAQLHVSFQVLRGLDRNIEFMIQGPGNTVLEHVHWASDTSIQKTVPFDGLYRFCLNNELSKFSSKLVYFYMVAYIEEKWHQHSKNILDFFGEAEGIQESLGTVDERVKKMHLEQANSRRNVISDWYLIQENNSYIQIMSIVLCVVIVVASAFQVFFVRHLFNVRNVSSKLKPRA